MHSEELEVRGESTGAAVQEFEARAIGTADELFAVAIVNQLERMRPATFAHSFRVADLAVNVARQVHLSEAQVHLVYWGALLHDIGELQVQPGILDKAGPLDPGEISQMREHTVVGSRWLDAVPGLAVLAPFARWHHERFDGEGYPDARSAQGVPLGVALVAVCDAWDALTQIRPFRSTVPPAEAAAELRAHAGRQWSRSVVDWTLQAVGQLAPAPAVE